MSSSLTLRYCTSVVTALTKVAYKLTRTEVLAEKEKSACLAVENVIILLCILGCSLCSIAELTEVPLI